MQMSLGFGKSRLVVLPTSLAIVVLAGALAAPAQGAALSRFGRNLIVVLGSDTSDNCTQLMDALTSAATDASNTNRYTVKITAGVVDCGDTPVDMRSFVDIEGSGELSTRIVSVVDGDEQALATVNGADDAELRHLTVENLGGGVLEAIAIGNDGTSPQLTHITAIASGGTTNIGIENFSATPLMINVTAIAEGGQASRGVENFFDSSPTIRDSVIMGAMV